MTIETDAVDNLPGGWAEARLDDLVYIAGRIGWRGLKANEYTESGPLFLSVHGLNCGEEVDFMRAYHISQQRYDESPEIMLRENDILLAKDGAGIGKLGIVRNLPAPATVNSSLLVVRALEAFVPKFLFYFLCGPKMQGLAKSRITGSATPHLFQKDIRLFQLAVPPLAEQKRIVAKVEALLARLNAARDRLAKAPTILKRFRQSVLAAACSGRLTADWRQRNGDSDDAKRLIHRIGFKHGYSACSDDAAYPADDLPPGWALTTLGFLTEPGANKRPFITSGSRGWADYIGNSGPVFIRSENINTDSLALDNAVHVSAPSGAEAERTRVRPGDLLLTITGNNVGRTAVVPPNCPTAHVSQHVAIIRVSPLCDVEYLWFWLRSIKHGQEQLQHHFYGYTKPGLNLEQIRNVVVALPPRAEQAEIVRRVRAMLKIADGIESRVQSGTARTTRMTQSILAKAFRGELVPTEAELAAQEGRDYETAEQLLERVRAAQQTAPAHRSRRDSSAASSPGAEPSNGDIAKPRRKPARSTSPRGS